ncbi:hypothetical protein RFI_04968 [Reticulomyxa filosa]|uniref:Uncharacterized protein n=1 Tax=Reticulomyxa filosa TaxID=46433 RepID=X6P251_RETFI|nr:hypothetical protein RFI_04968 [Reticulomyxa filosa]|eukprot:ETO32149.1 hypothetical protein RFI_04968 [Reticulomyxa filosa]
MSSKWASATALIKRHGNVFLFLLLDIKNKFAVDIMKRTWSTMIKSGGVLSAIMISLAKMKVMQIWNFCKNKVTNEITQNTICKICLFKLKSILNVLQMKTKISIAIPTFKSELRKRCFVEE